MTWYESLCASWPWYVTGPLIGLLVPTLLIVGNRLFGVSSSLRHLCAAVAPSNIAYFKYDWRRESWNLWFVAGIAVGGWVAVQWLKGDSVPQLNPAVARQLTDSGIAAGQAMLPRELFSPAAWSTVRGLLATVGGGFLVGFGARYAGGCTGGHTVAGLSTLQRSSLVATLAFFAGGLVMTWWILPWLLRVGG